MKKIDVSKSLIFSQNIEDFKNSLDYLYLTGYFSNSEDFSDFEEATLDCVQVAKVANSYYSFTRDGSKKVGYSWCGGRCRWMTQFKVGAISKFYKEHFKNDVIVEYVGIAKDELDRVNIKRENTIKVYPLIYWNMTENDCLVKCYKNGFDWKEDNDVDLYDVLDRVSCYCCGNKNLNELKAIYKHLPTYWQKLKVMQSKTNIPFRKNGETVQDLENKFEE